MKNIKSHFKFNKQERSGIFFLLLIIVILQLAFVLVRVFPFREESESFKINEQLQESIDSLKREAVNIEKSQIFPFNPNYITDYKGYTLGMSTDEIDRLHAYRGTGKFINSVDEFQEITEVSDSLLNAISPYFKFPEWVTSPRKKYIKQPSTRPSAEIVSKLVKDINTATIEDFKQINGIGDKLSGRIVKFRDRLGGFLIDEQLYDVYALEPEVAKMALTRFRVLNPPKIVKINVNSATANEIAQLVYIRWQVAERIVAYRENKGRISSLDELQNIEDFPSDKKDRIALYLSL
ncbi:ComEA family DNA-binding protein [Pseudozobellia sp. WGM2]|uniref:ComEA family DNA-binding protein n=1 Tax=Pseudozobellia sp. WGM2 TaxID=2787625 RepID=UPI001ADFDADD|nr:helix-hairpin-helix domain-containing protein [Pseudozobellia sp. WGM2]